MACNGTLLCWYHHTEVDAKNIAMTWDEGWHFGPPGSYRPERPWAETEPLGDQLADTGRSRPSQVGLTRPPGRRLVPAAARTPADSRATPSDALLTATSRPHLATRRGRGITVCEASTTTRGGREVHRRGSAAVGPVNDT